MLFFVIILAALALWAVIAAVLAMTHDGPAHPLPADSMPAGQNQQQSP